MHRVGFFIDPQWGTSQRSIGSFEHGIDIRDVGTVLLPASEFVQLNTCIRNLISKVLGAVDEGSGN